MIGRNGDVGCALLNHPKNGGEHTANGRYLLAIPVAHRRERMVVPKQFIGSINQVNFQFPCLATWYALSESIIDHPASGVFAAEVDGHAQSIRSYELA